MMQQPEWICVANLGDVNPIEHGGLLVFSDEKNRYPPEMEQIVPVDENTWTIHRTILESCTFQDGVLSSNMLHPKRPVWFNIQEVCRSMGIEESESIRLFCSKDAAERAQGWRMVGDYYGWENLDPYPRWVWYRSEIENLLQRKGVEEVLNSPQTAL